MFGEVVKSPALEMLKGKDTEQPTVADPVLSGGLLDSLTSRGSFQTKLFNTKC